MIVEIVDSDSEYVVYGIVQHKVCGVGFIKRRENNGVVDINTITGNNFFSQRVCDK